MKRTANILFFALLAVAPRAAAGQEAAARVPGYENIKPLGPDGRIVTRKEIPRTADGKPDLTAVSAGTVFNHRAGPNDSDTPVVSRLADTNLAPDKPGRQAF